jgi:hypothetical protein
MKPPEKWEIFGNIYEKNHGDMIGFNHGDFPSDLPCSKNGWSI